MQLNHAKLKLPKNLTILAATFVLCSCNFGQGIYSWNEATNNGTEINYCLLIGQNDLSDSIERTRATRKALGTLDESEETKIRTKNNPNLASAIDGTVTLFDEEDSLHEPVTLKTHEYAAMEQKSLAGVCWDPITANNTTSTWIAKYGKKLSLIVSNNDGMAEGAYMAPNWYKGLPIFGYDANPSTLELIKKGEICGTVTQNAYRQCATALMMVRNMIDNPPTVDKKDKWSPITRKDGQMDNEYVTIDGQVTDEEKRVTGFSDDSEVSHFVAMYGEGIDENNISQFFDEEGKLVSDEKLSTIGVTFKDNKPSRKSLKIFQAYSSQTEAFLMKNMRPFFNIYSSKFNISYDEHMGNGSDEKPLLDAIESSGACDAYLINMSKTTDGYSFISAIANKLNLSEHDNWEDRSNVPVIFWNRPPLDVDGETPDYQTMHNKFFKYTYFVGADSAQGGEEQGKVIKRTLERYYLANE